MTSCRKHATVLDDEGGCRECENEAMAAHPELALLVARSRRWRTIHSVYLTASALLAGLLWYVFMGYREWVIWTR